MTLGKLGVWYFTDLLPADGLASFAQSVERLGYSALWYPEAVGRDSVATASWLLSQTEKLVVASGIANIYARDAQATHAAHMALNEQSGGRFLLGLGVSHAPLVQEMRGHSYHKSLTRMKEYLEAMKGATYRAPQPGAVGETVLAALGPKMLKLAAEASDGAHPYLVTPEHTKMARQILGPKKKLYVEQKVFLGTDAAAARAAAREMMQFYGPLPNYQNNWKRMGFVAEDWETPSDRLMDAMVAWGDVAAIKARIEEHFKAGADHVCLQPLGENPLQTLEALKP